MDELDLAASREAHERDYLIAAIRRRKPDRPLPDGFCHLCGEDVEFPRLFCGVDCAEAYSARRR